MDQKQRLWAQVGDDVCTRKLARDRNHGADHRVQRACVDRDCAAERMSDNRRALITGALEKRERRERVEKAFAEVVGSAVIGACDAYALARHLESEPRIEHRRAVEAANRAAYA